MFHVKPDRTRGVGRYGGIVAVMATRPQPNRGRLYLREHREAKGLSAPYLADRMGMERESLLRLEREAQTRCTPEKQADYAAVLGIEPAALWRPPGAPSLDSLVSGQTPETVRMAFDVLSRIINRKQ